jgi:predicted phage terminase large subunit-like protein
MNTDPDKLAAIKALAKEDLFFFARYMFQKRKNYKWIQNWHQKAVCDALMRVYRGECKRLIINIPPRYSKTELAVVNFIAWCLALVPDCEFIHTSYAAKLAANNSSNVRDLVQHEAYIELFPETVISKDATAKDHWKTTAGGVVYATGAEGTITGFGAGKMREGFGGAIIIDDPHKADEAVSETMRKNVIDWFQSTLESRVNNPETPIILIMQRLHEGDLAGWLESGGNGEFWEVLKIPVFNEAGEPLWPWKHSAEKLKKMEEKNRYVFAGQYMQRPAPLGGGIYKDEWWRYYRTESLPPVKRLIQTWDTAFKAKESNDFNVCFTIAETATGYFVVDRFKKRMEFPELKRTAKSIANQHKPNAVLVEDKASGQSLIQELKEGTLLPIVAIPKDVDKVSCANAVTPLIESGRVFLPEGAEWVPDFLLTMGRFPNDVHDDDADALNQGLKYLAHGGGNTGMLDFAQQELEDLQRMKNDSQQ